MRHFLRKLYAGWMHFAHLLGEFNFTIIFALLYIFVVGLYAPFLYAGKLKQRRQKKETFWILKPDQPEGIKAVLRQY